MLAPKIIEKWAPNHAKTATKSNPKAAVEAIRKNIDFETILGRLFIDFWINFQDAF